MAKAQASGVRPSKGAYTREQQYPANILKVTGGTYENVDEMEVTGFAANLVNFYVNEFYDIVKIAGKALYLEIDPDSPVRGMFYWEDQRELLIVIGSRLWKVNPLNNTYSNVTGDNIPGTSSNFVQFTSNGSKVWMASGGRLVTYVVGGTSTLVADADAPTASTHVVHLDGYIIANQLETQMFYWTDLADPTSWSVLSFATADFSPDSLLAIHAAHRELYMFGSRTIEVWYDDGRTPIARVDGSQLEDGIAGRYAVTMYNNEFYFLNSKRLCCKMVGRQIQVLTNPYQKTIHRMQSVQDCVAVPVSIEGQNFIYFTFPSANTTLAFNVLTGLWNQVGEWNSTTSSYDRDTTCCSVYIPTGVTVNSESLIYSGYTGTCTSNSTVGTVAWTNPTNAQGADDGNSATNTHTATGIGRYLTATNFGFAVPVNTRIVGVQVSYTCAVPTAFSATLLDNSVRLMLNGAFIGANRADGRNVSTPVGGMISGTWMGGNLIIGDFTTGDRYSLVYGGMNDAWGLSLGGSDVNNSTFGIAFSPRCTAYTSGNATVAVNAIRMVVYYIPDNVSSANYLFGDCMSGKLGYMSSTLYQNYGVSIRSVIRTGIIEHNTLNIKRCNRVVLRLKRVNSDATSTFTFSWKDNQGDTTSTQTLGLYSVGDYRDTVILHQLGHYRTRQYEIIHSDDTAFIFVEMQDDSEILLR